MFGKDESFNSRTREGCDATGDACRRRYDVSIHAPGRGATVSSSGCRYQRRGFNSRTREGCDQCFAPPPDVRQCFNSRTREGCDSIDDITYRLYILFQFTHPGGVRQLYGIWLRGSTAFQVTHPGGVRPPRRWCMCGSAHRFNSRTREGCDSCSRWSFQGIARFQFTHPGGVRRFIACCC